MSIRFQIRSILALSLVAAVSPLAHAERVAPAPVQQRFAAPPPDADMISPPPAHAVTLDRATLRLALAERRAQNLAAFRTYEETGVFPSNVHAGRPLNVWRDDDDHYCAAATIILKSGATELVERVADQNNGLRLADVTTGPLMDWMLTSGLTQQELVLIQRPFNPVARKPTAEQRRIAVDARLRAEETARLTALYQKIEHKLDAQQERSLDAATDRLMKHPALAWTLVVSADASASS